MKSILMSIQPKWCELIASGKKTVEVRKTRPNLDTPFKVYIYQTKKTWVYDIYSKISNWQGKVIGDFVCDKLVWVVSHPSIFAGYDLLHEYAIKSACLTTGEAEKYANGKNVYGYHISDLKIYDKPKELSEFKRSCNHLDEYEGEEYCDCLNCDLAGDSDYGVVACDRTITRPPQSYCYIEETKEQATGKFKRRS